MTTVVIAAVLTALVLVQADGPARMRPAASATPCEDAARQRLEADESEAAARAGQYVAFAGIALTNVCGPIEVYAASVTPSFERDVVGTLDPAEVVFREVHASLARMLEVQDQITASTARLRAAGLDVVMYWPDMTTGYETLQVRSATPAQIDLVRRLFGDDVSVDVATNAAPLVPTAVVTDRSTDVAPFNAGDFIDNVNASFVSLCTGGPNGHTGSGLTESYFMITAGHCSVNSSNQAATGLAWHNGYVDDRAYGSQVVVGTTTTNLWSSHYDVSVIGVPAKTSINAWTGDMYSGAIYNIVSGSSALVGQTICTDGAFDGSRCGATVQSAGYKGCINLALVTGGPATSECGEIHAVGTIILGGEGDSGGPVYRDVSGPGLTMSGVISAESAQGLSCPYYAWRGNICSKDVWFVDLPTALSKTGLTLNSNTTGG